MLLAENGKQLQDLISDPIGKLNELLMMKDKENGKQMTELAFSYYLNAELPLDQQLTELETVRVYFKMHKAFNKKKCFFQLLSDYVFAKPIYETVQLHTEHSSQPTYYYRYAHRGQFSLTDMFGAPADIDLGEEMPLIDMLLPFEFICLVESLKASAMETSCFSCSSALCSQILQMPTTPKFRKP